MTSPVDPPSAVPRPTLWRRPLLALGVFAVVFALPLPLPLSSRLVLAYTLATATQCAVLLRMIARPRRDEMIEYAARYASRSRTPLVAAGVLSVASLVMLIYLVHTVGSGSAVVRALHVTVSLAGVILTWLVMNGVFALRYAALYYSAGLRTVYLIGQPPSLLGGEAESSSWAPPPGEMPGAQPRLDQGPTDLCSLLHPGDT